MTPRHPSGGTDCQLPASPVTGGVGIEARSVSAQVMRGGEQDVAIWIRAPRNAPERRGPLSLAVVIDRSGSMTGEPIERARGAAERLIDQLGEGDAFTVIAYSSEERTIVPVTRATANAKRAAHDAIDQIYADGGTCISCGLERGAAELERSPVAGLRRIVLISDGQANEGVADRGELAELAATIAKRGSSISAVGVGLDFDEVTMTRIAEVGHGSYYFVENTRGLDELFARELAGLEKTVASSVRVTLAPGDGAEIAEVYGYPATRDGGAVVVPIADLAAGEMRKVVARVRVGSSATGRVALANVALSWTLAVEPAELVTMRDSATAAITDNPSDVTATIDSLAAAAAAEARSASALEQATTLYEARDATAAKQLIDQQVQELRANKNVPAATAQAIERAYSETLDDFAATPPDAAPEAKPMKKSREKAYHLAR